MIKMLDVCVRELLEYIHRSSKVIINAGSIESNCREAIQELNKNGVYVIPSFMSAQKAASLRDEIDALLDNPETNVWKDSTGTDERIYFSESLNKDFKSFYQNEFVREMLISYTGIKRPVGMVLASRIKHNGENLGSGGGWHRDSPVTQQFKALCYLSDVYTCNGPFQYVKGSHKKMITLLSYFKKVFTPKQYRFSDNEVCNYEKEFGVKRTEMLGQAGDLIFADTKGIHTGKPISSGERYALFCYFWEGEIPSHFESLKQNTI